MSRRAMAIALVWFASAFPAARGAQPSGPAGGPKPPFDEIGIDQRLGEPLPLGLTFRDEQGREARLADYASRGPLVLTFAYFRCPMLCSLVRTGLASSLAVVGLKPGTDYTAVTVSIDPRDTPAMAAAAKKEIAARWEGLGGQDGWRFLTGDETAIRALADAAGFRYVHDAATDQYAHASGVMVVTPDGRLSQYLLGIDYAPRDLRLALVEASGGRIGTLVDRLTLLCYQYDPATGHYGFAAYTAIRTGGVITVLALSIWVIVMFRRESRAARRGSAQGV